MGFIHGHSGDWGESPTHVSWAGMMGRCYSKSHSKYSSYGAKGITVCDRWHDFRNFLQDMGERPAGHTIDRIELKGNYEPSNCRWATAIQQANNKTTNRRLTIYGETLTIAEWSRRTGISARRIWERIFSNGWDPSEAVSIPPCKGGGRNKARLRGNLRDVSPSSGS